MEMGSDRLWCVLTIVDPDGSVLATSRLEGNGEPDLASVDDVARTALLAKRLGGELVVESVAPALRQLLDLAGLDISWNGAPEHPASDHPDLNGEP